MVKYAKIKFELDSEVAQLAFQTLGISPDELSRKNRKEFEEDNVPVDIVNLRYENHVKRVNEKVKWMEEMIHKLSMKERLAQSNVFRRSVMSAPKQRPSQISPNTKYLSSTRWKKLESMNLIKNFDRDLKASSVKVRRALDEEKYWADIQEKAALRMHWIKE